MPEKEKPVTTSLQQHIVRSYKIFGLVALVGILLGLVAFLVTNVFYLFDNSWVRPVILDSAHEHVVQIHGHIAEEMHKREEARNQREELVLESQLIDAQLAEIKRFAADHETVSKTDRLASYPALMARRELHSDRIDAQHLERRKRSIKGRIKALDRNIANFDAIIERLQATPYARAAKKKLVVAFVPYENLDNVEEGLKVYGCKWGLLRCSSVGRIGVRIQGEVEAKHPQSDKTMRGLMVELRLVDEWAAEESALFVDGRPLWLF